MEKSSTFWPRLRAEGCGTRAVYLVECRNEAVCDISRRAQ